MITLIIVAVLSFIAGALVFRNNSKVADKVIDPVEQAVDAAKK